MAFGLVSHGGRSSRRRTGAALAVGPNCSEAGLDRWTVGPSGLASDPLPEIPVVETERLRLRPWREADLDPYAEMCADPEVMRYIGSGRGLDRDEAWRQIALFIGHWALRGYGLWAVEKRADESFIGRVGLWRPEGWPGLELGWFLGRAHWGHGYATEAGRAALDFAWETVHARRILSLIQPSNQASRRVAERLGMHLGGRGSLGEMDVVVYRISQPSGPAGT